MPENKGSPLAIVEPHELNNAQALATSVTCNGVIFIGNVERQFGVIAASSLGAAKGNAALGRTAVNPVLPSPASWNVHFPPTTTILGRMSFQHTTSAPLSKGPIADFRRYDAILSQTQFLGPVLGLFGRNCGVSPSHALLGQPMAKATTIGNAW